MTPSPHAITFRARPLPDLPAVISSTLPREDARWIRPTFRPPPLVVTPNLESFGYSGTIQRTEPWASAPR